MRREPLKHCSFCQRPPHEVTRLIEGPSSVFICDECVQICQEILEQEMKTPSPLRRKRDTSTPAPMEIFQRLNDYVVGQDRAKKVLAVAVYNHYKRTRVRDEEEDGVELQKSNILLIGPTGCGKTLLAQTLARILDVPFALADATTLTEAGYVGEDVENILLRLIQAADGDLERASRGIVYVDEIDKIARKTGDSPSITRDVSGEGVQQALLKILEGTTANVPPQGGRKHPYQEFIQLNTTDILFICGGAFAGLEEIIASRRNTRRLGFASHQSRQESEQPRTEILEHVNSEDLMAFGFIPELVGRLPVVVTVEPLDEEMLVKILVQPKNALVKQFQKLFALDGVELVFTEEALGEAAREAMRYRMGARGLRSILEETLLEIMYQLPSRQDVKRVTIDAHDIGERKRTQLPIAWDVKEDLSEDEARAA